MPPNTSQKKKKKAESEVLSLSLKGQALQSPRQQEISAGVIRTLSIRKSYRSTSLHDTSSSQTFCPLAPSRTQSLPTGSGFWAMKGKAIHLLISPAYDDMNKMIFMSPLRNCSMKYCITYINLFIKMSRLYIFLIWSTSTKKQTVLLLKQKCNCSGYLRQWKNISFFMLETEFQTSFQRLCWFVIRIPDKERLLRSWEAPVKILKGLFQIPNW